MSSGRGYGRERRRAPIPDEPPFTAYVGNLPSGVIQGDVEEIFKDCQVKQVRLIHDRESNRFKGYGYVEFDTREGLMTAVQDFDGACLEGKTLKVDVAEQKQDRRGGNDGGRGGQGGYNRGGYNQTQSRGGGGGGNWGNNNRDNNRDSNREGGWNTNRDNNRDNNREGGWNNNRGGDRGGDRGGEGGGGGRYGGRQNSYNNNNQYENFGQGQQNRQRIDSRSSQPSADENRGFDGGEVASSAGRPRLNLKARTKPVESSNPAARGNSSIFGAGKAREEPAEAPKPAETPKNESQDLSGDVDKLSISK